MLLQLLFSGYPRERGDYYAKMRVGKFSCIDTWRGQISAGLAPSLNLKSEWYHM